MEKLQVPELKSNNKQLIADAINQIINGNVDVLAPIKDENEIVGYKKIYQRDILNSKILNVYSKISYVNKLKCEYMRYHNFIKVNQADDCLEELYDKLEKLNSYASYDIYQDDEDNIYNFEDIFKEYQYDSETGSINQVSLEVSDVDDITKGLKYITEMR